MADKTAASRSSAAHGRGGAVRGAHIRAVPRVALVIGFLLILLVVVGMVFFGRARRGGANAIGVLQTGDFHALAFSPDDPNVVFFGHHNGVMRSNDGGRTWSALVDQPNFDAMGLAVSPDGARQMYLAGHDVFQVSNDGGASWQPVVHNLPGTDIHGFAVSPDDPNRLYAFVAGRGGFQSADSGRTWQPLGGNLPEDVMALAAGSAPATLYANSMGSGVLRSTDGGRTWAPAMAGLESGTSGMSGMSGMGSGMALVASGKTVYAGMHGGLYKSADGGATWSKLSFPADNVAVVGVSPTQPNIVLAVAANGAQGLVYRSQDGGLTWIRPQ